MRMMISKIRPPRKGTAEWRMYDEYVRALTKDIGEIKDDQIGLFEWASTYRANLTPDRRFNLSNHRYLREIYNDHKEKVRVIYKSSQMGASEYAISYAIHCCDARNATVLYVFPTDTHVGDFSSARIGPAIEASDYLMRIVVDWKNVEGKRGADRTTLKRIRNRFMYLRGSGVKTTGQAPQLKSIDADVLIMDEIDEMNTKAPAIAEKRTGHSSIAEQLWISTPTYAGFGIHAKWMQSDQREWFIPCPSCGEKQPLSIHNCVIEWDELDRPVMWHGYPDDAYLVCEKCESRLDRLVEGEWVQTYSHSNIIGWHMSKMFSSMADIYGIVEGLQSTDETERKEIFNQDLGLPYSPKGGRLTREVLNKCKRSYLAGSLTDNYTFMGVDVGSVLHVVVRAMENEETGERKVIHIGTVDTFLALGNLLNKYNVGICVIDALPETRKAREFQTAYSDRVWLAYYAGQVQGTKKPEELQWNKKDGIVTIERTRLIDTTLGRFYSMDNTLPANAEDIPEYFKQLIAPIRVVQDNIAKYINNQPDHFTHAETYCTAASLGRKPDPFGTVVDVDKEEYMHTSKAGNRHKSMTNRRRLPRSRRR